MRLYSLAVCVDEISYVADDLLAYVALKAVFLRHLEDVVIFGLNEAVIEAGIELEKVVFAPRISRADVQNLHIFLRIYVLSLHIVIDSYVQILHISVDLNVQI